ncbi:hypothetical protein WN944_004191 [Citrus x changshan-huyou]|uniref:Uncharacterized protein n=1 Tax=Citrus x changshan-huyou TaxID=2935761 RepID=A0AAP0M638_9ROSI
MLRCHRNACVCALIAACIILSMSSSPLLIEARIPEFGAIQGANLYSFIFQIHVILKFNPSEYDGTFNPAEPQADS